MANTDKHQPHVFMDVDELPMTPPFGVDHGAAGGTPGGGGIYAAPNPRPQVNAVRHLP
jgi:hypothetical protein